MSSPNHSADTAYWEGIADRLRAELDASTDPQQRAALLDALYRVLGDRLGRTAEAGRQIEAAVDELTAQPDILWESWRAAATRDSSAQAAALAALAESAERPADQVAARLALARLQATKLESPEEAGTTLEEAALLDPEDHGVRWAKLFSALADGDGSSTAEQLEALAQSTADPIWRATVLLELVRVRREQNAPVEDLEELLGTALDQPGACWTIVNDVARTSETLELWELQIRALERLAGAAIEEEPEAPEGLPPGHVFQGFKRGAEIAAAHWWMISSVAERRLEDHERALAAIERACALVPDTIFLELERARLLEASGRAEDALGALPDSAPPVWTAELALVARQPELAASVARAATGETPSVLGTILAEVASLADGQPVERETAADDPWQWLIANPRHEDAPAKVAELIEAGTAFPIAAKVREETQEPPAEWPGTDDLPEDAPWAPVVAAVTGPAAGSAASYLAWAERAETPELESALVAIAARAAEEDGDPANALELCRRSLDLDPSQPESARQLIRLLRQTGEWEELADRMADLAAETTDPQVAITALHERALILEYQLKDYAGTNEALQQIVERDETDVFATCSATRIAIRLGDWEAAVSTLQRLAALCPADGPRLELLCAEIELFALGRDAEAITFIERQQDHLSEPFDGVAHILSVHANHSRDDLPGLAVALNGALQTSGERTRDLWLLDLLETVRGERGPAAAAELLGNHAATGPALLLWKLIVAGAEGDVDAQARALTALAEATSDEAMATACRTGAGLIGGAPVTDSPALLTAVDASPEALWQAADELPADAEPLTRARICGARAALASDHDPYEEVDWLLGQAEALEDARDLDGALVAIGTGLERLPDHLGLLEARAHLALTAGKLPLAAETHRRLADAYVGVDEQATQLALAASLLLEADDQAAAEEVAREAVERAPSHEEAHEVLTRVLQSKGDEKALAQQIEDRIDAVLDDDALIELYQEQADRLMAVDDMEGALEAIENLLLLQPRNMSAHRTKIDLLIVNEEWEPALEAMQEFIGITDNWADKRQMVWRAADLLAEQLNDPKGAIEALAELAQHDDHHPQTERNIARFAEAAGDWDEVAAALERLGALVENPAKKGSIIREQAQVRIERLFDPEGAAELIETALSLDPGDIKTVKMALELRPAEEATTTLAAAEKSIRERLSTNPVNRGLIADLSEVAGQLDHRQTKEMGDLVLGIFEGRLGSAGTPDPLPAAKPSPEELFRALTHPAERNSAAAKVLQLSAAMSAPVFSAQGTFPEVGRATLVGKRTADPVRDWLRSWAEVIGITRFDFHRAGQDPRGSIALPGVPIAVAVTKELAAPMDAAERFFLARHLWRAARGFGAFPEGDAIRPVRWVLAVAAAVLGADAPLPLPTDSDLVSQAHDVLTRKLRKQLQDPCQQLVQESPQLIKDWITSSSYSADRFGLLAGGELPAALPALVEESAGPAGLRRLSENAEEAIGKVPRGRELLRFVLAGSYMELLRSVGLADRDGQ